MFEKMGEVMGRDFFTCETARQSLQDAGGFVNVHERRIKIPVGTWPKDKKLKTWGEWNRHFVLQGLEGFSIRGLTSTLGVSSVLQVTSTPDWACKANVMADTTCM